MFDRLDFFAIPEREVVYLMFHPKLVVAEVELLPRFAVVVRRDVEVARDLVNGHLAFKLAAFFVFQGLHCLLEDLILVY